MRWCSTNLLVGVLLVAAAVLTSYSVAACRMNYPAVDYIVEYELEVANDAADGARVRIHVGEQDFKDIATGVRIPSGSGSGIIFLRSGQRRMFEMSLLGPKDSPEDNDLVRSFRRIEFFEENSDSPYKSYDYPLAGCRDVAPGSDCSDDMWISYKRPDGPGERLFVVSRDRPFFLEQDRKDPDLGRIVITFLPEVDAGPGDAVN